MYSRSINSRPIKSNELRVPQNYRGNAFSFDPPKYEPPVERESDIVPKKKDTPKDDCETTEECSPSDECPTCEKEEKNESISSGFSFEDILLIALILILSQNGADDDILLLLALILAYKK